MTSPSNIISGNNGDGIYVYGRSPESGTLVPSSGTVIKGNFIGVRADGVTPMPNEGYGVLIRANADVTVGTAAGGRNIISGNEMSGIGIVNSKNITIGNNVVGAGADGKTAAPNGVKGIFVDGDVEGRDRLG
jgi:hypothetical protein